MLRGFLLVACILEISEFIFFSIKNNQPVFMGQSLSITAFYIVLLSITYVKGAEKIVHLIGAFAVYGTILFLANILEQVPSGIINLNAAFCIVLQLTLLITSFFIAILTIWLSVHSIIFFAEQSNISPEMLHSISYIFTYYGVVATFICYLATQYRRSNFLLEQGLEEAKIKAEEADKTKSVFLATMSHEIRTPLNGILGILQSLQKTELNGDQKQQIEVMRYSGDALLTLINDILDFTKLEAGRFDIESVGCSVNRLSESVIMLMSSRADEKGLKLETIINDDVPKYIKTDPTRLRQILLNLIGNAIKFTESGSVTLKIQATSSSSTQQLLKFSVIDTGIGITDEAQKSLFSEFIQADTSITRKYGGSGLGLSICKKIVVLMGGDIGLTSVVNEGSTFWFEIPIEQISFHEYQHIAVDVDNQNEQEIYYTRPLSVLVAEDNMVNQKVLSALLDKSSYHIEFASNGQDALDMLRQGEKNPFDIILMDMQMPVMDGLTAIEKIRAKDSDYKDIPIVALTANSGNADKKLCLAAGANDFLSKPIDQKSLLNILHRQVKNMPNIDLINEEEAIPETYKLDYSQLEIMRKQLGDKECKELILSGLTNIDNLIKVICEDNNEETKPYALIDLKTLSKMLGLEDVFLVTQSLEICLRDKNFNEMKILLKDLPIQFEHNKNILMKEYLNYL